MPKFEIEGALPDLVHLKDEQPPEGVAVRVIPPTPSLSSGPGSPPALAIITFTMKASPALVATWLAECLVKRKAGRIRIRRKEIPIQDAESTARAIEEEIEIQQ